MTIVAYYNTNTKKCRMIVRDENCTVKQILVNHTADKNESYIEIPTSIPFNEKAVQEYIFKIV